MPYETTTAPADLLALMADIQQQRMRQDWPEGFEGELWREAEAGTTDRGRLLHELAEAAGCWYAWNEETLRMEAVRLPTWKRWMRLGGRR